MIAFSCQHCGMKFNVKDEFTGRSTRCPTCKQPLIVPSPNRVEAYVTAKQIDGFKSSLAQAGVDGGVTIGCAAVHGQRSVGEVLAGRSTRGERYIIEKEIARGGMGAVLRAVDCDIRREVAVKYMLGETDPRKKLRFIEEAQITGQLEHPNIVPIHELGVDKDKRLFFSMKMVKGRSLKEVLDSLRKNPQSAEKEYTLGRLMNVLVNVCNGLAYAHSRGVVHRDLKPANLMLGDFGEVYVMDWGLAKVLKGQETPVALAVSQEQNPFTNLDAPLAAPVSPTGSGSGKVVTSRQVETDLTQEGAIMGTALYMAPEQAMGKVNEIDQRSDVYSSGAILYEMLTLQAPVDKAGSYMEILQRVTQGEIVPPEQRDPKRARAGKIPRELSAIAMKALAKEPRDRYQNVEMLRKDIERFQEGRSVSAKEDTRREMLVKFVKRNKGFSAGAASALLVLMVSLWFLFGAWRQTAQAYAEYKQEQQDKEAQARKSVPAFYRAARLAASERQFDDALIQVNTALEYDSEHAEAHLLKGQLLIVKQEYADAAGELDQYTKLRPGNALGQKLLQVCRQASADQPTSLLAMADILREQKAYPMDMQLIHQAEKFVKSRQELLVLYQKWIEAAWPKQGPGLSMDADGKYTLVLQGNKIADLTPLKGMAITSLDLQCPQVRDLTPLKDLPLTSLNLTGCGHVRDLTLLKGMNLRSLNLQSCSQIDDLTPLIGMPLTRLSLQECRSLKSIAPLQGMPLNSLNLAGCGEVRDLTPLKGMPLTALNLSYSGQVHDLTPLKGMPLTALNLNYSFQVHDLTPLKGMPLNSLNVYNCFQVRDLTPLKGMPLTALNLCYCGQVDDLTPLKGMPLTSLALFNCRQVSDLTPLKGMPLTGLDFRGCARVQDLTPLQGMNLIIVSFTPKHITRGTEAIRQMKSVKTINGILDTDFWKKYDAGEFNK